MNRGIVHVSNNLDTNQPSKKNNEAFSEIATLGSVLTLWDVYSTCAFKVSCATEQSDKFSSHLGCIPGIARAASEVAMVTVAGSPLKTANNCSGDAHVVTEL